MSNSLVTIATFSQPFEGHIVRTRLESEGIRCFVADEHTVAANWFYSNAIGGVKLQVREADQDLARSVVEDALSQLDETQDNAVDWSEVNPDWTYDDDDEEGQVRCPSCDSTEVYYEKFSRPLVFLSILLLGIPIPFLSRRWNCQSCGHHWKMKLFK